MDKIIMVRPDRKNLDFIWDQITKAETLCSTAEGRQEGLAGSLRSTIDIFRTAAQGRPVEVDSNFADTIHTYAAPEFNPRDPESNQGFFALMTTLEMFDFTPQSQPVAQPA